ncbi:beta-lactamase/transpeptidase-like protein [Xylariomycetidae sp. FL2044]|nr:beta-lactamase/transpeptidase-like protein [Xylariomycetidae sp. FL2044]
MNLVQTFACWTAIIGVVSASCEATVSFPPPVLTNESLADALTNVSASLTEYFSDAKFDGTNVAIEITSSTQPLFSFYYAAPNQSTQTGVTVVDSSTIFRVVSNTKIYTALAILQLNNKGTIESLDAPVTDYLSGLGSNGAINWTTISLRGLLNNMAGIPNAYGYGDLITVMSAENYAALGLPAITNASYASVPACELNTTQACTADDLYTWLESADLVLKANMERSHSDIGYSLLGLVLANVTGERAEDAITNNVFGTLGLNSTSFRAPDISLGAVPHNDTLWTWDLGVNNPTDGVYASSSDMAAFLRWILVNYDSGSVHSTLNWFAPGYYGLGSRNHMGMPWSIFRTTDINPEINRPVTINTVRGNLGSSAAISALIPDYNLGVSILMSGALADNNLVLNEIITPLVRAADMIAINNLTSTLGGTYSASSGSGLNTSTTTSVTLAASSSQALYMDCWTSNGIDVLDAFLSFTSVRAGQDANGYLQLSPTFAGTIQGTNGTLLGERWRWLHVLEGESYQIFNDWCVSMFDAEYASGIAVNEMIFWRDATSGETIQLEIPSYGVTLTKESA